MFAQQVLQTINCYQPLFFLFEKIVITCLIFFLIVATIVLVGNKTDLFKDLASSENDQKLVNRKDGNEMAGIICADAYRECSAKLNEGVQEVFHAGAKAFFLNVGKPFFSEYKHSHFI